MKQTAVEWLVEKLSYSTSDGTIISHHKIINKLFDHAKEMEKEQIVQAITKTIIGSNVIYGSEYPEVIHTAEQYYNKTFKSE